MESNFKIKTPLGQNVTRKRILKGQQKRPEIVFGEDCAESAPHLDQTCSAMFVVLVAWKLQSDK